MDTCNGLDTKTVEVEVIEVLHGTSLWGRHSKAVGWVYGDRCRVHPEEIEIPIQGSGRVSGDVSDEIGKEPVLGRRDAGEESTVGGQAHCLHHEALRSEGRGLGHLPRAGAREHRIEGGEISGPRARMVGWSRGGEADRPGPMSTWDDDWLISLGNHGSYRRGGGENSARLLGVLARL